MSSDTRICPRDWHRIHARLTTRWQSDGAVGSPPPVPLILAAAAFVGARERQRVWLETLEWAERRGWSNAIPALPDVDYLHVDIDYERKAPLPTRNSVAKVRIAHEQESHAFYLLRAAWPNMVGHRLAELTDPVKFTGTKRRRLLVHVRNSAVLPPWGTWTSLDRSKAAAFTRLRALINRVIYPHEVDHIEFNE